MDHRHFNWYAAMVAILFLSVLTGCRENIAPPELRSIEIRDLSRTAGDGVLSTELLFHNPNDQQLTVKRAAVRAKINQRSLPPFSLSERTAVPPAGDTPLKLDFHFSPDDVYPGFLSRSFGAIGSKRVRVTLEGEVEFIRKEESFTVPVQYSEIYKIPG